MTDSLALQAIGAGGDVGGFQQQGSVDWVTLGGSVVSFTVDTLARMSRAGVEVVTVTIAHKMLKNLNISEAGEKRAQDAIDKLPVYSSFSKALYFGFGLKHLIRAVTDDSRDGITMVAVCSCLTEAFNVNHSAKILRNIYNKFNPPDNFVPPLKQWEALVKAFSGAISLSTFPLVYAQMCGLCDDERLHKKIGSKRMMGDPERISSIFHELLNVSNGKCVSVTIVGGQDCLWFAALAHWLLDFEVEITKDNLVVYHVGSLQRSKAAPNTGPELRVIFTTDPNHKDMNIVKGRTFVIPAGHLLSISMPKFTYDGYSFPNHALHYGRVEWDTILKYTFGLRLEDDNISFLYGEVFGLSAAILQYEKESNEERQKHFNGVKDLPIFQLSFGSYGNGFVCNIPKCLPELGESTVLVQAMGASFQKYINETLETLTYNYLLRLRSLREACSCEECFTKHKGSSIERSHDQYSRNFCHLVFVLFVSDLVQYWSSFSIHGSLLPTRIGVEELYIQRQNSISSIPLVNTDMYNNSTRDVLSHCTIALLYESKLLPPEAAAILLFTGRLPHQPSISRLPSQGSVVARTIDGISWFHHSIIEPTDDLDKISLIHIIPGSIQYNDWSYNRISFEDGPLLKVSMETPHTKQNLRNFHKFKLKDLLQDKTKIRQPYTKDIFQCHLVLTEEDDENINGLKALYHLSDGQNIYHLNAKRSTDMLLNLAVIRKCHRKICPSTKDIMEQPISLFNNPDSISFDLSQIEDVVISKKEYEFVIQYESDPLSRLLWITSIYHFIRLKSPEYVIWFLIYQGTRCWNCCLDESKRISQQEIAKRPEYTYVPLIILNH